MNFSAEKSGKVSRNYSVCTSSKKVWKLGEKLKWKLCDIKHAEEMRHTRIFFNKGHLIRDSTEKIRQNKGHSNIPSTELDQNKGQENYCFVYDNEVVI